MKTATIVGLVIGGITATVGAVVGYFVYRNYKNVEDEGQAIDQSVNELLRQEGLADIETLNSVLGSEVSELSNVEPVEEKEETSEQANALEYPDFLSKSLFAAFAASEVEEQKKKVNSDDALSLEPHEGLVHFLPSKYKGNYFIDIVLEIPSYCKGNQKFIMPKFVQFKNTLNTMVSKIPSVIGKDLYSPRDLRLHSKMCCFICVTPRTDDGVVLDSQYVELSEDDFKIFADETTGFGMKNFYEHYINYGPEDEKILEVVENSKAVFEVTQKNEFCINEVFLAFVVSVPLSYKDKVGQMQKNDFHEFSAIINLVNSTKVYRDDKHENYVDFKHMLFHTMKNGFGSLSEFYTFNESDDGSHYIDVETISYDYGNNNEF